MSKEDDKNKIDLLSQTFQKRLADYELPVSEKVWEKIESDLPKINQSRKPVRIALRFCAAAAVIALLLSLGLYRYFYIHEETITLEATAIDKAEPVQDELKNLKELKETKLARRIVVSPKTGSGLYAENQKTSPNPEPNPESETILDAQPEKPVQEAQESHPQPMQNFTAQTPLDEPESYENLRMKKNKQKISVAVGYGNSGNSSFVSTNSFNSLNGMAENNMVASYDQLSYLFKSPASGYENNFTVTGRQFKMPVAVGLSIRKHLTDDWALESGLTYSYLESSESGMYTNGIYGTRDVGLHYLGVPLKVIYAFYNNKRLSLYAAAGGMAEKTVYGEVFTSINNTKEKLDVPELQWSISGSIGLSYKLIDHLYLFAEPGIGYYFDDKSAVTTIRDDKPTNFNLLMGVRLSY